MLYYFTKSNAAREAAAEMIADGKNHFAMITRDGAAFIYDGRRPGHIATETATLGQVIDAVEIWPLMSDDERKAAHKKAVIREGLRTLEERAEALLARQENLTAAERMELLHLVNIAYHSGSSKIEEIYSIDSTAACDFCERMRAAAEENLLWICHYCYAAADSWKEAAWRRHKLNARILGTVLFEKSELATLAIGEKLRFNEDGDTVNETMARNYLRIGMTHPATNCGYWYKNSAAVEAGLHAEGIHTREARPANIRFVHSSVLIGFPAAGTWFDDIIFTVYPDKATTEAAIAAGSWECNGRKCKACGFYCYTAKRQDDIIHVAEVLRTNKAARARILAAFLSRREQIQAPRFM